MSSFITPPVSLKARLDDSIRSLPELVQFHTRHNPNHLFCTQAEKKTLDGRNTFSKVTYANLENYILNCQTWLKARLPSVHPPTRGHNGTLTRCAPVALFLESDLGLVIHILALMGLGVPIVLLSTRLSPLAICHLLHRTGAAVTLTSPTLQSILSQALNLHATNDKGEKSPQKTSSGPQNGALNMAVQVASSYESLLKDQATEGEIYHEHHFVSEDDRQVVVLHSSGSSGLPKPIYCSHRHFLGFSQCHELSSSEAQGLAISTSPFFHGFGLVPICLSLGVGKPFCIPSPTEIPTSSLVVDLIQDSEAKALLTVPSVVEEIALLPENRGIKALRGLDFVAFGGGIPKDSIGQKLKAAGVRLINHYGATETGPLAPFFVPQAGYDWHYIRLRRDILGPLDVRLEPVDQPDVPDQAYKLSMQPFGWQERFELQDLLIPKPGSSTEFSIAGRTDDLICLATGEKVRPTILEACISQHDGVKGSAAFGDQQFELGIIVESREHLGQVEAEDFKTSLWPIIEQANLQMDEHARITSSAAILIVPPNSLPRSDKGTVLRREMAKKFESEIAQVYRSLQTALTAPPFDVSSPASSVRALVEANVEWRIPDTHFSDDDDFFEIGMDSLQAVKLRRLLVASVTAAQSDQANGLTLTNITDDIVYRNPSVNKLAKAVMGQASTSSESSLSRLLEEFAGMSAVKNVSSQQLATVLVTGSTGSLGSFFVAHVLRDPSVARVICLVRASEMDPLGRQKRAFESRGIVISEEEWSKIELHEIDLADSKLGISEQEYRRIASEVTHIIHIAWPMNFKLSVSSFNTSFKTLQSLIHLCTEAHRLNPQTTPRLLFISSISTVGNHPYIHGERHVLERPMDDVSSALDLGYAKAKFVCEKMIERAALQHPQIQAGYVRVGQVAGAHTGIWNADEHFVALIISSQKIGKFPQLRGTFSWLPVDSASAALADILFSPQPLQLVYHLENPVRQGWGEMVAFLVRELGMASDAIIPYSDWMNAVSSAPEEGNPAKRLIDFLGTEFRKMSCGEIILDTHVARQASSTMRKMQPVGDDVVRAYLRYWRSIAALE